MEEITYKIRIDFIEPILGSQPTKNVASTYIAQKAGLPGLPEDEEADLPEMLERGTTVFHRHIFVPGCEPEPALVDYQVKGFLKAAAHVYNGQINGIKALKSKVENLVFVSPRFIQIKSDKDKVIQVDKLERSLRAQTAQGDRVALAISEMIPAGCYIEGGITVLGDTISQEVLEKLFDYGLYKGIGQWRNGGYGRFRYSLVME